MITSVRRHPVLVAVFAAAGLTLHAAALQSPVVPALHAKAHKRLLITNAMGIPYHAPTLMREAREMVAKARADRARSTTP